MLSFFRMAYYLLRSVPKKRTHMGKRELFEKILTLVEEETEISRELILSGSKREEVVDARALLISLLHEQGLYPAQIGAMTGICPRCIGPFILNFKERVSCRKMLRAYYEKTTRILRE